MKLELKAETLRIMAIDCLEDDKDLYTWVTLACMWIACADTRIKELEEELAKLEDK